MILAYILLCSISPIHSIAFSLAKRNILIAQNSQYLCNVQLTRQNAQLIPTEISVSTTVANTLPTFGDFFDYFYYLTQNDLKCYKQSVNNQSYLFPCAFISNKNSRLRINYIQSGKIEEQIDQITNLDYSFIVDNTLFPYPNGAFTYSYISIDVILNLEIYVSSSYAKLGIRLIFINVTVFLIFLTIWLILIYKTRKLSKMMNAQQNKTFVDQQNIEQQYLDGSQQQQQLQNQVQQRRKIIQTKRQPFPIIERRKTILSQL